jgi:hypothetical protein
MTLGQILDDAAGAATAGRRLDPAAVTARARRRRSAIRRHRTFTALAVAACWTAVLGALPVLAPGVVDRAAERLTGGVDGGGRVTGLPDRWGTPPEWVPRVTRRPIPAASMLLSAVVRPDEEQPGGVWRVPGTVVVSADGRQYRSLPPDADSPALAADGRTVAYAEATGGPRAGARSPVIVLLRLATGAPQRVPLSTTGFGGAVTQVLWSPDGRSLIVVGQLYRSAEVDTADPGQPDPGVWRIDVQDGRPTGPAVRLCGCQDVLLAYAPDGTLRQAGTATVTGLVPGAVPLPDAARTSAGDLVSTALAISPDGTRWADVEHGLPDAPGPQLLVVHGPGDRRATLRLPTVMARDAGHATGTPLTWTAQGILLAGDDGVWRVDPVLTSSVRVSSGDGGASQVIAVAAGAAGSGAVVAGSAAHFPWWEPERLADRVRLVDRAELLLDGIALVVVTGLVFLLVLRVRRVRRGARPGAGR